MTPKQLLLVLKMQYRPVQDLLGLVQLSAGQSTKIYQLPVLICISANFWIQVYFSSDDCLLIKAVPLSHIL